jgi:hypothetical protein
MEAVIIAVGAIAFVALIVGVTLGIQQHYRKKQIEGLIHHYS